MLWGNGVRILHVNILSQPVISLSFLSSVVNYRTNVPQCNLADPSTTQGMTDSLTL